MGLAGFTLERIVGHAWIFCIFVLGAVCGGLATILLMPPSIVSVGASGGVMAVLGALFMTSFRLPEGPARSSVRLRAVYFGVPSLIPHHVAGALQVNFAAHSGGAIFGLLVGGLLLGGWETFSTRPPHEVYANLLAAVAIVAASCSAYAVSINYGVYGPTSRYMPSSRVPTRLADIVAQGDALAAAFPDDTRAHFYAGLARLVKKDRPGAEYEIGRAIALDDDAPGLFPSAFTNGMRITLASLIRIDGRMKEALALARPFCMQHEWTPQSLRSLANARAAHLCP